MIQISPDGEHILSGTSGTIVLDNKPIVQHASGWAWVDPNVVAGPGGFDITPHGNLGVYNLTYGYAVSQAPFQCSAFYARPYIWLATINGRSWDSNGNPYEGKIALGVSDKNDLVFTDTSNIALYIKAPNGIWQTVATPSEWTALPSGGFFSRNFQGCFVNDVWYACGYLANYSGLCLWTPFKPGPIYRISTILDYGPGIGVRKRDGMLIIGTGINQGETYQRRYEIDLTTSMYSSWQHLPIVGQTP